MKRISIILLLMILLGCHTVYANLTANQIRELNDATPGTFKVQLGTVISAEQASIDTNTTTGATNSTNITTLQADVVTAQNTADTAFNRLNNTSLKFLTTDDTSITNTSDLGYVRKYTGSDNEGINLAGGGVMQILTFALAVNGGGNFAITPDTSSGFDQINLTAAGDNVTLRYIDSSIGWTLLGMGTSDTGKVVAPINPFN